MTKVVFSNSRRANWPQLCDSLTQLLLSLHGVIIQPTLIGIWWVLFPLCLFSTLVDVSRYFFINVQNEVYILVFLLISFYLLQWLKTREIIIKSLWSFHSCLHPQRSVIFGMWEVTEGGEAAWPSVWGVSVCQISGKSSLEHKYMSLVDIEHESETAWRHLEQIFTMANHKGKWTSAADCSYYC